MPYDTRSELPDPVKENLPKHAQDIYKGGLQRRYERYADPKECRGDASREEVAHKVAWAAVKQQYEKEGDTWVRK